MRFYRLDEVPIGRDDVVFKESPALNAMWAVILLCAAATVITCGIEKWLPHRMEPSVAYWIGGFLAVFGLFPLFSLRAALKPTNWLLRYQLGGLFIKYRAYENWRMPADTLQVVGLEFGEIASAKLVKERRKRPNTDGKGGFTIEFLTYVELATTNPNLSELEANLAAEREVRPTTGMKMVIMDYPVQVLPNGVVQIRWGAGIRPSAKKALQVIGQRVQILEMEHRKTDLTYHAGATPEEQNAKIMALAQSGDHFAAIRLARQVYGYDLTKATQFVNTLTGKKDGHAMP